MSKPKLTKSCRAERRRRTEKQPMVFEVKENMTVLKRYVGTGVSVELYSYVGHLPEWAQT